jgi:Fe-S-cluster containining protein
MQEPQTSYQLLLEKIEALAQRQIEAYGKQIRCKQGCYDCCYPPDTIFQVEALILEQSIADLPSSQQQQIAHNLRAYELGDRSLCPLLDRGICLVYEARPVICRTQGFALWHSNIDQNPASNHTHPDGSMSWCAFNFTEQQPERSLAFNLKTINMMLSMIVQLSCKETAPRREIVQIIDSALRISANLPIIRG